jgi:phosphoribosylanthranilate isomerase
MMACAPDRLARPQIKICGLTQPGQAARCAAAGADAIGLVFFPKSPRHVGLAQARAIVAALPEPTIAVGVFVNADFDGIMTRVDRCGLAMVQLHGNEPANLVTRLRARGVGVIKTLFIDGHPGLDRAAGFAADAFLVECAAGPLPGGNAMAWDWRAVGDFGASYPLVLAGGLSADNVAAAIAAAAPAAVDVSSGVEASPGCKDLDRVAALVAAVHASAPPGASRPRRTIFGGTPVARPA